MDLRTKQEFVVFMKRAVSSNIDDCYIELYNLLLRSFVSADVDFDGKVDGEEFNGMIEAAAALPRKFDEKWWDDGQKREDLFKSIDDNNDGAISFDEWLAFVLKRYQGLVEALPKTPDEMDKDGFVGLCKDAQTPGSDGAKTMYFFHWKSFQAADADRDGQVSEEEFDLMINYLIDTPKRLGVSLPSLTPDERKSMFTAMDANGDGAISFDEWLTFSMDNIIAKIN
eukprot:GFUD01020808.1.p1 GENE.GFUD01020808.1~~GFUD01020808.1.p1  ORF type:complete len:226 (-),score=81.07 GFUD01020808.1:243-920(-)